MPQPPSQCAEVIFDMSGLFRCAGWRTKIKAGTMAAVLRPEAMVLTRS